MKKKILVIDNSRLMLHLMTDLLENEGYEVLAVEDGLSALDILRTCIPDVIFVDLIMPNIGGLKLCQIIRSTPELKNTYLVILSAIAAEEEPDMAELGVNAYIAKGPFNQMTPHILNALDQAGRKTEDREREIMGIGELFPREITRELLSRTKNFEVIINSMQEGILEVSSQHRIVYANPSAIAIIGRPEEKLLGKRFFEIFASPIRERIEKLLETINAKPQMITEESPVKLNGKLILLNIIPVNGDRQKAIIILNDVTERKRMEDQLLQAQKVEAIGTLAGGIAHDFNNLLSGILGNVSLMLLGIDASHPHYEKLKRVESLVQSGAKLTSQLLGYARKGKYKVKPLDLNQIVLETSETFGRTRKEITIHRELGEDLFPVEVDQGQIEQVLFNLYINAADAMPGSGNLILKTMNITHEEMKGKLYNPKPGKYILITVTDTGTGMDEETQRRIFEPFFTTKEMGRGTGLGLASVYGIIKGHSGYIDVDSEKGKGATFAVYLPATKRAVQKVVESKQRIVGGTETILLVDDEDGILVVGKELLERFGYQVLLGKSGEESLGIYKQNKETVDLIVLDMIMPKMGGGETYDRLKQINPRIKVLLSSGYSIDGQATEILERGCNGFIQKPYNPEDLCRTIREILDKK